MKLYSWKPIKTAPKDDTRINIWSRQDGFLADYIREDLGKGNVFYSPYGSGLAVIRDATHWMEIPTDPNI